MPEQDPLLTAREVQQVLRISRRTFYRLRHRPDFPAPLVLGPRSHRWRRSAVRAWADGKQEDR